MFLELIVKINCLRSFQSRHFHRNQLRLYSIFVKSKTVVVLLKQSIKIKCGQYKGKEDEKKLKKHQLKVSKISRNKKVEKGFKKKH